jgi:hypothetical protein
LGFTHIVQPKPNLQASSGRSDAIFEIINCDRPALSDAKATQNPRDHLRQASLAKNFHTCGEAPNVFFFAEHLSQIPRGNSLLPAEGGVKK